MSSNIGSWALTRFPPYTFAGFLKVGGYEGIPLERNAYMLGARYEKDPARRFPVADEVAGWIAEGRF
jgi:hypothetical protein